MKEGGPACRLHMGKHPQWLLIPLLLAFNTEIIEEFWFLNHPLWRLLLLPYPLSVSGIKVVA